MLNVLIVWAIILAAYSPKQNLFTSHSLLQNMHNVNDFICQLFLVIFEVRSVCSHFYSFAPKKYLRRKKFRVFVCMSVCMFVQAGDFTTATLSIGKECF